MDKKHPKMNGFPSTKFAFDLFQGQMFYSDNDIDYNSPREVTNEELDMIYDVPEFYSND